MSRKDVLEGKWKNGLIIGDEMYFDSNTGLQFVFINHPKPLTDMKLTIETHLIESGLDAGIVVEIHKQKKDLPRTILHDFEEGSISYPGNKALKEIDLGCDSASFLINGLNFDTGADGHYGNVYTIEDESLIILYLSDDMSTVDNFHDSVVIALKESFA